MMDVQRTSLEADRIVVANVVKTTPFQWLMISIGWVYILAGSIIGGFWGYDLAKIAPTWATNHDDGLAIICGMIGVGAAVASVAYVASICIALVFRDLADKCFKPKKS